MQSRTASSLGIDCLGKAVAAVDGFGVVRVEEAHETIGIIGPNRSHDELLAAELLLLFEPFGIAVELGRHLPVRGDQLAIDGVRAKLGAKIGVRNFDESHRALTNAFAMQVRDAVLGDHVVHVAATRDDAGARRQFGHDAGSCAARCGRWQRQDRAATVGHSRSTNKVHLAADTGIEPVPHRVGNHLTGEIDFDG